MPSTFGRAVASILPQRHLANTAWRGWCAATTSALFALALGTAAPVVAQSGAGTRTFDGPKIVPKEFNGDLSKLPPIASGAKPPKMRSQLRGPARTKSGRPMASAPSGPGGARASMPPTTQNFAGMTFADDCGGEQCGSGWPPDPNGEVGPNHFVEAVNTSYAIYSKTGTLLAAFSENALWAGSGANQCNGNSQGDPIVVYDALADRWILTHFAFSDAISPFVQCIAVSKTSDPVAGGYWLYPLRIDTGAPGQPPLSSINDYPKFGAWHDCLYMSANQFDFTTSSFQGVSFASFSRADLYSGLPLTWSLGMLPFPANDVFSMVPSHSSARGANAVTPGTPNFYAMESIVNFEFEVRTFAAGPNCGGGGTMSAPHIVSQDPYTFVFGNIVPQPNTANTLDMIDDRVMQKVQYRKVGGVESIWVVHTVGVTASVTGQTGLQWAQMDVTGGTIAAAPTQQQIYTPDTALYRFMPSITADNQGNVAIGYSTSAAVAPNFPSIAYAGRLAGDPPNTLPQTEAFIVNGAGSQTNTCGSGPCDRWGDYSAMSLDPVDECTFWYTNQYYTSQANGTIGNWSNRIGSFKFPGCTSPSSTAQRTFVASNGSDVNACSLAAPCRSFGAAILKTSSGGEVVVLDSAGYGPVVITKPVSLIAPPGVYAGVSVFSGTGIVINPVAGKVTLRGLTINALGGTTGIDYQTGDALYLDHVAVSGFPTAGLNALAAGTGTVQIHDSLFRGNGIGASFGTTGGTTATLKVVVNNSNFDGNTTGIRFTSFSAQGEIRGTTLAGGTTGALLAPTIAGAITRVDFVESTISGNTTGIQAQSAAGTANVSASSTMISGNTTGVMSAAGGNVFLTASTITRNGTGLSGAGGTITSGTLNRLYNNGTSGGFTSTVPRT